MISPEFPRVDIPGIEVTDEGREIIQKANEEYAAWRDMRLKAYISLVRMGQSPYKRPNAAEVVRRRAAGRRQRQARKLHRD